MNQQQHIKAIFTSQHGQSCHAEYGCGVASLLMVLKHAKISPMPTWEALCQALCLSAQRTQYGYSDNDPRVGLYPEHLLRYMVHHQYLFRVHFYQHEWQTALERAPIMVMLDGILPLSPESAHWVVLMQYDGQTFSYLDPWEHQPVCLRLPWEKWVACYSGIACQLLAQHPGASGAVMGAGH